MRLVNETGVYFAEILGGLTAQVVYDLKPQLQINQELTYGVGPEDLIKNMDPKSFAQTKVTVFDLNLYQIRECRLEHQKCSYSALNIIGFFQFVLGQLTKKALETEARFELPVIKAGDTINWSTSKGSVQPLELSPLPWKMKKFHEFRSEVVEPIYHLIHYYPIEKQLKALLVYPIDEAEKIEVLFAPTKYTP